jgi:hypothetical protein
MAELLGEKGIKERKVHLLKGPPTGVIVLGFSGAASPVFTARDENVVETFRLFRGKMKME